MGFVSKRQSLRQTVFEANSKMPMLFLVIITMAAIGVFIQLDRMKPSSERDIRAKAFIQTATGVRIEGEEMTLSGNVTKDATNSYLQF